jgi:hypothetical protein
MNRRDELVASGATCASRWSATTNDTATFQAAGWPEVCSKLGVTYLSRALFLLLLVPVFSACGGKSSSGPDTGQAGDSGSSSTGASAPTGGSTGVSGSAQAGGSMAAGGASPNGGAAACAQHDDESPVSVEVLLINKTSKTIYLGQDMVTCGVAPLFAVTDASGVVLPPLSDCRAACAEVRKPNGVGGCTDICRFPSSIELAPGGSHAEIWDALYDVDAALPGSCVSSERTAPSVTCSQAKRIVAGTYTFRARAGTTNDCSMTTGAGQCAACMPDGNGGCTTQGALIGGAALKAEATVTLDASYGFSTDSNTSSAGDAPGAVAPPTVELFFIE